MNKQDEKSKSKSVENIRQGKRARPFAERRNIQMKKTRSNHDLLIRTLVGWRGGCDYLASDTEELFELQ